jgi:hypothetical protein
VITEPQQKLLLSIKNKPKPLINYNVNTVAALYRRGAINYSTDKITITSVGQYLLKISLKKDYESWRETVSYFKDAKYGKLND